MQAYESGSPGVVVKSGEALSSPPSRGLLNLLSPGGLHSRLSILIYHRVLPVPDPLFPEDGHAEIFDNQMGQLAACFNIISLLDAIQGLQEGSLPPRAACITFDDGYADNAEVALPILQKHGLSATFFVATSFLNGGRMWNDTVIELIRRAPGDMLDLSRMGLGQFEIGTIPQRRQAIHDVLGELKYLPLESRQSCVDAMCAIIPVIPSSNLMMTSDQIRILHHAGMEIGGHTANHPILASMENKAARTEIADGKEMLESIIHAPVRLFAYPNGKPGRDYLSDHVKMVRDLGFEAAVSTAHGAARTGADLYQLPRFTPWDRGQIRFILRMAQNMLKIAETI
ncbi:MAG: polysaccharide deacetylase family protein [Nitrosospira sp.]|nr:polysaccharide deacetylase family protein [Nitrosospira sp.]